MVKKLRIFESLQILVPGVIGLIKGASLSEIFSWTSVIYIVACFCQQLFIYSFNDYCDYEQDSLNPRKKWVERRIKKDTLGNTASVLFILSTGLFVFLPWQTAMLLCFVQVISIAYSAPKIHLKSVIPWAQVAHFLSGIAIFLSGKLVVTNSVDWGDIGVGVYFGLLYLSGGLNNELLDHYWDKVVHLKTLASVLGEVRTLRLIILSQFMAILFLLCSGGTSFEFAAILGVAGFYVALVKLNYPASFDQLNLLRFRRQYRLFFSVSTVCLAISWMQAQ